MIPTKTLHNGFALPVLGLGTWMMGGDVKRAENPETEKHVAAIRHAIGLGLTHIDTAEIYAEGEAERLVGEAIRGHVRAPLVLASKVYKTKHHYNDLKAALHNSLERMDVPYLDLYYLHAPNPDIPMEETAKALNELHAEGLVRHVGVSNFLPERLERLQDLLSVKIVANQVHYNLVFREPDRAGMFDHAVRNDYFVVAWRPVRFKNRQSGKYRDVWEKGAWPMIEETAARYGASNTQIALNWVAAHPNTVTLVGSSNPAHLDEVAASFAFTLEDTDFHRLQTDFAPQEDISDTVPLL